MGLIWARLGTVLCSREQASMQGKNGKAIPVTDRGDTQGCEKSRLPHFLDS
jgi:hypothetical protein